VLSIPTCRTRRRARGNFLGNVRRPTQPRLRVATALVRREGLPAGRGALEATLRDPASNTVRRSALVRASPGAKALLSHRSYPDADWPAVRISWIPTVGGSSASDAPPDPRGRGVRSRQPERACRGPSASLSASSRTAFACFTWPA